MLSASLNKIFLSLSVFLAKLLCFFGKIVMFFWQNCYVFLAKLLCFFGKIVRHIGPVPVGIYRPPPMPARHGAVVSV